MALTSGSIISEEAAQAALDALLAECVRQAASDLHLAPGQPPFLRVRGELVPIAEHALLDAGEVLAMTQQLLRHCGGERGSERLAASGAQDGAFSGIDGTRYRFNAFRRQGGVSLAIRRLADRFRTLTELGLPESLYALCDLPDGGLVVVAGPTGAGKSTTLAALVDRINQTSRRHLITIEDPVEYLHTPAQCLINQRQIGADAASFHDALIASLREDPDVIVVGEVRDLDTIRTAIRAAETGHLVFTSVHAGDSAGTIERLVSVFPADEQPGIRQQLALVLRAVVSQRLLPRDGSTRGQGPRERIAACEILIGTPAIANLIAAGKSAQILSAIEGGSTLGMQTLEQDLARLLAGGIISEGTALAATRHPGMVQERLALMQRRAPGAAR